MEEVKTKHAGGRPIKEYNPKYVKMVDEYLLTCTEGEKEFHKTRSDNSNTYERILHVNLPKIEGFSQYINTSKTILYEWEKKYPEFMNALDKIREVQHNMLIDGGISNRFNPAITKLMLSNNHGYVDRKDVTTDGKSINMNFDNSFKE